MSSTKLPFHNKLPYPLEFAIDLLNHAGYKAYLVGGSIRDFLLNLEPKDFDIATNAKPDQIQTVFKDFTTIPTGIKYGTITVIIQRLKIEITSFRQDKGYSDFRRPDEVYFSQSIKEDLKRRDFTINALAYHPREGLLDFFGGEKDLAEKHIRAVGHPKERFTEDPLRILRGLRFAARLNFSIEKKTGQAMLDQKDLILKVSPERIQQEFRRILTGKNPRQVLLNFKEIFGTFIPEMKSTFNLKQYSPYHIYDVYRHSIEVTCHIPPEEDLRLAGFFHDIGKAETFSMDDQGVGHFYGHSQVSAQITENRLRELKFENKLIDQVHLLVKYHDIPIPPNSKIIKKRLAKFGSENFFKLLAIQRADTLGQHPDIIQERLEKINLIENLALEILKERPALSIKDLSVNGYDAMSFGLEGGQIGLALKEILALVLDEKIKNERQACLDVLERFASHSDFDD